jgi:hypothetical protein
VHRLQQYGFLLCYSLFAHEQKLSVLHFHVTKYPAYTEPLKSKDELLFMVSGIPPVRGARPRSDIYVQLPLLQTGFRSFMTKPVFSESNLNCDKHKFERFLLVRGVNLVTSFEPSLSSTCSCLRSPTGSAWPAATARPACPPARCWSSSARPTPGTRRASGPPAAAAGASLPLAAWPTWSLTESCSRRY